MNNANQREPALRSAASVSDVCRMLGLSRARFYQLQRQGVFPLPQYDPATRRPFYDEEGQRVCLDVRRRNCGVNGKPVLFYAPRRPGPTPSATRRRPSAAARPEAGRHAELIEALKGLGLEGVSAAQVDLALRARFPAGVAGRDEGEVVRAVFLHLRRQNRGDNDGR